MNGSSRVWAPGIAQAIDGAAYFGSADGNVDAIS
jgi:hypothetical protein